MTTTEQKYHALYTGRPTILAVQIRVCNLQKPRENFSGKWDELVPLLEVHIGKLVQSKLSEGDKLLRRAPLNYYLVCPSLDREELWCFSKRKVATLFEKVFNPDPILRELQISIMLFEIPSTGIDSDHIFKKTLYEQDNAQGLHALIYRDNFVLFKHEQIDHILVKQIATLQGVSERFFSEISGLPQRDDDLKAHEKVLGNLKLAADIVSKNIARLIENEPLDKQEVEAKPATPAPPPFETMSPFQALVKERIAPDAEIVYYPTWNVQRQKIDVYRCTVIRRLPSGNVEVLTGSETQYASHVIDSLVVNKLLEDLHIFTDPNSACLAILPLHINTIMTKKHFSMIKSKLLPLTLMEKKQLFINITGVTNNTPDDTIQQLTNAVRPFGRFISFRVNGASYSPSVIKKSGAVAIGFHTDDYTAASLDVQTEMTALTERAEAYKLSTYIQGVQSLAVAATAIGSGVSYISGEAIAEPIDQPWGSVKFNVENLYSRFITD